MTDFRQIRNAVLHYMMTDKIPTVSQVVITRHFGSPPGSDDKKRGLKDGEYERAVLVGEFIAKNYLLGDETNLLGVTTNRDRSKLSINCLVEGIKRIKSLKTNIIESLELAVDPNDPPATLKTPVADLGWGGPGDALSYIVQQMLDETVIGGHYSPNIDNMAKAYAKFLQEMIGITPGTFVVVSGHAPSERSHLIGMADCLRDSPDAKRDFREIREFLKRSGSSNYGGISCSYVIAGDLGRTVQLILGDCESGLYHVDIDKISESAKKYNREAHISKVR